MPSAYITERATTADGILGMRSFSNAAYINAAASIPRIYPPVASKRREIPPENPENTGSPIAPRDIYIATESTEYFPPKIKKARKRTRVCAVIGRARGIQIYAETERSAAKSAERRIFARLPFRFFI